MWELKPTRDTTVLPFALVYAAPDIPADITPDIPVFESEAVTILPPSTLAEVVVFDAALPAEEASADVGGVTLVGTFEDFVGVLGGAGRQLLG